VTASTEPAGLSVADAAAYCSVSAKSMRRAVVRGEIPVLRLGSRVIVPRAALDALFADVLNRHPAPTTAKE
jgi:excisionase family DNA binding protein